MSVTNAKIAELYTAAEEAKTIKGLRSVLMDTLKGLDLAFTAMKDMEERLKYQESFHPQLKTTADFKEFLVEINSAYLNISDETFENIEFTKEETPKYINWYIVINREYYKNEANRERMQRLVGILKANAYKAGYTSTTGIDDGGRGYLRVGELRNS